MSLEFCSLSSGSSGNCQFIATENIRILIDSGLSGKRVESFLETIDVNPNTIDYILVTHEHSDHTKGVGILSRRYRNSRSSSKKIYEVSSRDYYNKERTRLLFQTRTEAGIRIRCYNQQ